MTKSLSGALTRLTTIVDGITGIRRVEDNPIEQTTVWPVAMIYLGDGTWGCEAEDNKRWNGDLVIELHTKRDVDLVRAYDELMGYIESVPNAIEADLTLNSTIDRILFPMRFQGPRMANIAGIDTLYVIWFVPVIMTNAIA